MLWLHVSTWCQYIIYMYMSKSSQRYIKRLTSVDVYDDFFYINGHKSVLVLTDSFLVHYFLKFSY